MILNGSQEVFLLKPIKYVCHDIGINTQWIGISNNAFKEPFLQYFAQLLATSLKRMLAMYVIGDL